jgi:hypothetical protein
LKAKKKHVAHLAHHSHGRMRIRVPSAKGDAEELEAIRRSLSNLPFVNEVKVTESLGSITIHYDPSRHGELHQYLTAQETEQSLSLESVPKLESAPKLADLSHVDEMIEREAEFLARNSHTAKAIVELVRRADHELKRVTGNAVDLKVVFPLALAVATFVELGVTAATPVWLTLGLFSFNHFVEMHTHNGNSGGQANKTSAKPDPERGPKSS